MALKWDNLVKAVQSYISSVIYIKKYTYSRVFLNIPFLEHQLFRIAYSRPFDSQFHDIWVYFELKFYRKFDKIIENDHLKFF